MDEIEPTQEPAGVPPAVAILLLGNLFLIVAMVVVPSMMARVGIGIAAAVVLGAALFMLMRHITGSDGDSDRS